MIAASLAVSVAVSLAMDLVLLRYSTNGPITILPAVLFNGAALLQSLVGGIIEWRRPGHTIGRLMMIGGPLYALVAAGWLAGDTLRPLVAAATYQVWNWAGSLLSWPAVALVAGWIPLLFPTGKLPGPRWRVPAGLLSTLFAIGVAALAVRPGPISTGTDLQSPIAIEPWPRLLQPLIDAIPLELVALMVLAVAALITRYRRGDRIERLQIRWFVAAAAVVLAGFVGVLIELAVRTNVGPLVSALVAYVGILAMPISIGIAVTRYRLFEIDRIISRTIGWGLVTGLLVAIYLTGVLVLQSALSRITQGQTLAVAASTLLAAAAFQPLRRRIQHLVDRRFDRARYDGERTTAAFAERLRDQVDLQTISVHLLTAVDAAVRPTGTSVWLRGSGRRPPDG
jgi:hypothetical protein